MGWVTKLNAPQQLHLLGPVPENALHSLLNLQVEMAKVGTLLFVFNQPVFVHSNHEEEDSPSPAARTEGAQPKIENGNH